MDKKPIWHWVVNGDRISWEGLCGGVAASRWHRLRIIFRIVKYVPLFFLGEGERLGFT